MLAWEAIDNGVVDENNRSRKKYWKHWQAYTKHFNCNPYLSECTSTEHTIIITAFAARVRTGHYGKGNTVRVPSVTQALAAISKTIELAGEQSPIYSSDKIYKLPVARLIEGFRREDPPSTPQLAVPVSVPEMCQKIGYRTHNDFLRAVGDLSIIAFFYLLRVGEYTKPRTTIVNEKIKRATRTVQFKVAHIGFFKHNAILPRNSPLHLLLAADSCTLKISNQSHTG